MLQKKVVKAVLNTFPELTSDDARSTSMGASGVDVLLSSQARRLFPYGTECKNLARIAIYGYFEQCRANVPEGDHPLLVIKQNHSEPLAVVTLEHFMELVKRASTVP